MAQFASGDLGQLDQSSAFSNAVAEALDAPHEILHKLFSVRAAPLLHGVEQIVHMPDRLSGLLIGVEIAGLGLRKGCNVTLVSSGDISDSYAHVLQIAGAHVKHLDADEMVRAGLFHCGQQMLVPSNLHDA